MKSERKAELKTLCSNLGNDTLSKFKISLSKYDFSALFCGYICSLFNVAIILSVRSWSVPFKMKTSLGLAVKITVLELFSLLCS